MARFLLERRFGPIGVLVPRLAPAESSASLGASLSNSGAYLGGNRMNMRFFALLGAVACMGLSACVVVGTGGTG